MNFRFVIKYFLLSFISLQEINSKLNEKLTNRIEEITKYKRQIKTTTNYSQTEDIAEKESIKVQSVASQTVGTKIVAAKKGTKLTNSSSDTSIVSNGKEDAHLLATIRGMRVDLAIKEKAMQRITRELDECKKTIKKLQKERDGKAVVLLIKMKIC